MKRLVLITDVFPFGKGEKSFIMPELIFLKNEYKVTILSRAPMYVCEDNSNYTILDDDIELLHYPDPELKRIEKWGYLLNALCSKHFRKEMATILKERLGLYCLKETYFFRVKAIKFQKWMREMHLFDDLEDTIFYSYWANYSVYSLAMEKSKNSSLRFVSRTHRYDLYNEHFRGGRQPFKLFVDEWIDKMIFIAQEGYDYYINRFAVDKENTDKYEICRLGVPSQPSIPQRKEDGVVRLVSCSVVNDRKRVELIVQALAKLSYSIEWHHFGDGVMLSEIAELSKELLDMKDCIKYCLHGYTSNTEIIKYYQSNWFDCFITTSASEGCPVSIQEAMSFGMPVIGTDVGEIRYMIDGNGVLLPTNPSVDEVAKAISYICECTEKDVEQMRNKSLSLWERDYQIDNNAGRFIELLKSL